MSASLQRNDSGIAEPLQMTLATNMDNSNGDNWLIHEFDNSTLIDNAPYVGLRKVDSLAEYLLVGYSSPLLSSWCWNPTLPLSPFLLPFSCSEIIFLL